ncbi:hypothetical protein FHR81_000467 [Actinoalloteichus hoggarensis]|uniref:ATP-binding protein n=1 Tax=Actinoalloteichus hoggarensis TaxID=1470176 RepID=UPI0012FD8360|nr:hypothetical protein [Actinoalloteichus hoggarensis]MBB5919438.1 hypothetical protein [Actinoalloteichus hoggarensis]
MTVKPAETEQDSMARGADVHLRVAATAERIALVRGLAGDLAAREEFDMDRVEDFRLAVEEACAVLIRQGVAGEFLHCRFRPSAEGIELTMRSATRGAVEPVRDGFGWHVLETLSDSVRLVFDPPDVHSGLATMRLEIAVRRHSCGQRAEADAAEAPTAEIPRAEKPTAEIDLRESLPGDDVACTPTRRPAARLPRANPDFLEPRADAESHGAEDHGGAADDVPNRDMAAPAAGTASMTSTVSRPDRQAGTSLRNAAAETSGSAQ